MAGSAPAPGAQLHMVVLTLDAHLSGVLDAAGAAVTRDLPGFRLSVHMASRWANQPGAAAEANADIATADIIVAHMLFMEDHYLPVIDALVVRREQCLAMMGCLSAGEIVKLTRMGKFRMDKEAGGALAILKRLRGKAKGPETAGARQMTLLRRLPKILRFIPGTAQDVRAYFLGMGYLLAGSAQNMEGLIRHLVARYAPGHGLAAAAEPVHYPDVGVYHPRLASRIGEDRAALPMVAGGRGTVGLLLMRSYVLAGDTGHYDGVIAALEARGLNVVPAFASGLDSRPAVERFFLTDGKPAVDAIVSLTGFSLVGGPAYNDAGAAVDLLARLDVPYLSAQATEFQTLEAWRGSPQGLTPVETVMMVALPELDGACVPMTIGGRAHDGAAMAAHPERADTLARRVARLVALRTTPVAERRIAITIFNFPPNAGATGTAAYLSVFASLWNVLVDLKAAGHDVDLPASREAMIDAILTGNAARHGMPANVFAQVSANDHIGREPHLRQIEAQWGAAPGKHQANGSAIHLLGARFGNVLVGVQPAMGYEGDPMRLLFDGNFAPTHAFSAYYRHLREDFGAHALLHFGTHGALEFMPGKQSGLTGDCWPERLIGDLPHFYLYAANNPSEAAIAKRRGMAVTISHLTPPLSKAGLYKGLVELKASIARWYAAPETHDDLLPVIATQAAELDLIDDADLLAPDGIDALSTALAELEATLIPNGLHIVGQPIDDAAADDLAAVIAEAQERAPVEIRAALVANNELPAIRHALGGGYVAPVAGGDILTAPDMLPTGRNIHGFDPFRLPTAFASVDGTAQAERLLARHLAEGNALPETVAMVLWGTDTLKSGGAPIAQVLALIGARPRFDGFGRLAGAELIPLAELGRPRIDVVATLSGIFRDLLPLQVKLIAEAAYAAATADEPAEVNFVRKHMLAEMAAGADIETAALRVFSNAQGAYGANVNHLIESGLWEGEDEIADQFSARKGFAYARSGQASAQGKLLDSLLGTVDLAYQNLESAEIGVTSIDHYFDSLGGIARAATRRTGAAIPVYVGDQTSGRAKVRTMAEQVSLETRTRALNPRWYEAMLDHGMEGVRQIEASVTNTFAWSATTGQVQPWVYQRLTQTYVLDEAMRRRLSALNPTASARMAHRLIEAHDRNYWRPDAATLAALRQAGDELDDRMEGIAA
jgi:magnesium chelatase subunit H